MMLLDLEFRPASKPHSKKSTIFSFYLLPFSVCFLLPTGHPGHSNSGQAYPSSGLPMALSPSGNQPQYNPHSSHQPSLPATNPQYHSNQGMVHSNQVVLTHTNPRPQSARCLLQTKGQKSTDGYQEQVSCLSVCLSVRTPSGLASHTILEVCFKNRLRRKRWLNIKQQGWSRYQSGGCRLSHSDWEQNLTLDKLKVVPQIY